MTLATPSPGYPGTIQAATWAQMQRGLGARYWVDDQAALKVTPKSDGTREVNIAGGYAGGYGIMDHNNGVATLQLPTVPSGTKWFLVCLRRTWGSTNASSFVAIDAGTSDTALPTRNTNPGTIDDQPLALVSLASGAAVPGTVHDLRLIGTAKDDYLANHDLVRQYADWLGIRLRVGQTDWQRILNVSGTPTWLQVGAAAAAPTWQSPGLASGWANYGAGHQTARYIKLSSGLVVWQGLIRRPSVAYAANTVILTAPIGYRPTSQLMFRVGTSDTPTALSDYNSGRIDVRSDGGFLCPSDIPVGDFISLSGIHYPVI